jgi:hypothetical protein
MEQEDIMTANEPAAAYGTNSYAGMMMMLYTMPMSAEVKRHVGQRLVEETTGRYLMEAVERIDHLSHLKNDWDRHGALPISRAVLNNIRSILLISNDEDWRNWMISPDVNATICLFSPRTKASISLGASEYSYYAKIKDDRYGESHIAYSPQAVLKLMRKFG